ncbi:MAG TPA: hypothetical protein VN641_18695 [Urbifossiella sp.]|nr:hypothetical protein [Urbifossiella sp.]
MSAFVLDDVAKLVGDRCTSSTLFTGAIPGGSFYGRAPDAPAAYPYAVFWFERRGEPQRQTDGSSWQLYTLRMAAYCPPSSSGQDPGSVQAGMDDALTKNPTTWATMPAGSVVHCLAEPFDGKFAKELRQAQDVFVVGGQWVMALAQYLP